MPLPDDGNFTFALLAALDIGQIALLIGALVKLEGVRVAQHDHDRRIGALERRSPDGRDIKPLN